jgi:hypothetical protein
VGGEGAFENMGVDRGNTLRAFRKILAHADFVWHTWSLRLNRDQKGRREERTTECRFHLSARERTCHTAVSDLFSKVVVDIVHIRDARGVVWDNGGPSYFGHRTNGKARKEIMDKSRIKVKNVMFVERIIKSIRIIRRNNFIKNMRIKVKIRIKNTVHDRGGKVCIR